MRRIILIFCAILIASCAPQAQATNGPDTAVTSPPEGTMTTNEPAESPFSPQPGDQDLTRGNVYLNEASLLIRESYPPQIALSISGDLPTPCNQLRVNVAPPDTENRIDVELYSVIDPDKACVQVLEPFEELIELGTFPTGHYSVWINGEMVGEFDS